MDNRREAATTEELLQCGPRMLRGDSFGILPASRRSRRELPVKCSGLIFSTRRRAQGERVGCPVFALKQLCDPAFSFTHSCNNRCIRRHSSALRRAQPARIVTLSLRRPDNSLSDVCPWRQQQTVLTRPILLRLCFRDLKDPACNGRCW